MTDGILGVKVGDRAEFEKAVTSRGHRAVRAGHWRHESVAPGRRVRCQDPIRRVHRTWHANGRVHLRGAGDEAGAALLCGVLESEPAFLAAGEDW